MFLHVEDALKRAREEMTIKQELTSTQLVPQLHAVPGTAKWKGESKIRTSFTRVLVFLGFGQHKQKYGTGLPPCGWLAKYPWIEFRGPGRCFTKVCTELIISIL